MLLKRYVPQADESSSSGGDGEDVLSFHDPDSLDSLVSPDLSVRLPENVPRYPYPSVFLFGPCNGILCIKYADIFFLCNPALREFKPFAPCHFDEDCPEGYGRLNQTFGFGFDPRTNVYKFVLLYNIIPREYVHWELVPPWVTAHLYDSSTDSWRQIDASMVPDVRFACHSYCSFNGAPHWTMRRPGRSNSYIVDPDMNTKCYEESKWHSMFRSSILHFNVSTEVFGEFDFPDWMDQKTFNLIVFNDCLAVVRYLEAGYELEARLVDIWAMKEYGVSESWTKQYVIGPYLFKVPFFCWKNEWMVVEVEGGQLASCAFQTNEIKRIQFYGMEDTFCGMLYKESLISVNELAVVP